MRTRALLKKLHLYLALLSAVPIFVAGVTGTILVFFKPADYLINKAYHDVSVGPQKAGLNEMLAVAARAHPDLTFTGASYPRHADRAVRLWGKDAKDEYWVVYVDPYAAKVTGGYPRESLSRATVVDWIMGLHYSLRGGEIGGKIVGFATLFLIFSVLSGLYLWLPKKWSWSNLRYRLKPGLAKRWKQNAYTWHSALGFYFSLALIAVAFTGIAMVFRAQVNPIVYFLTFSEKPADVPPVPNEIETFDYDLFLASATAAIRREKGDAPWVDYVAFPGKHNAIGTVYFQESDELYGITGSHVAVDSRDGSVKKISLPSTRNAGEKVLDWVGALHFGTWGDIGGPILGWVVRILWVVVALMPPFFVITGITIWRKPEWYRNWNEQGAIKKKK